MIIIFQSLSGILLTLGILFIIFAKKENSQIDSTGFFKIPVALISTSAVLSIFTSILFNQGQTYYTHTHNFWDLDYDRIQSSESQNIRLRYKNSNLFDETDFTYILSVEFDTTFAGYRKRANLPDTTVVLVGISSITYDSIFAKKYLEHIFDKYPSTKDNYISYYSKRGYQFDSSTPIPELAKALHNRNSHQITLSNDSTYYVEHYDMGRLCPPNCPN